MIEVFETWFNQFSKVEQDRLIRHILKNHATESNELAINYPETVDKKKYDSSSSFKSRSIRNVKSVI